MISENEKRRKKEEEAKKNADHPPLREAEVLVDGHEVEDWSFLTRQTTVGKIAWLAADNGWTVKVGESQYRKADAMYKGEVREGKVVIFRWVQALAPNGGHHLSVSTDLYLLDGWPVDELDEVKIHIVEYGVENG